MKIRIQFAKYGKMIYIGHLDIMRYFQKALRRADVDLAYTQGYNPHPILSFAAPLGVGITSCGEYADLEVNSSGSSKEMLARLNEVMVPGMEIIDYRVLPDDAKNAMSCVAAADYCLTFQEKHTPLDTFGMTSAAYLKGFKEFLQQESIVIIKETKKGSTKAAYSPGTRGSTAGTDSADLLPADGSSPAFPYISEETDKNQRSGFPDENGWSGRSSFPACRISDYDNENPRGRSAVLPFSRFRPAIPALPGPAPHNKGSLS